MDTLFTLTDIHLNFLYFHLPHTQALPLAWGRGGGGGGMAGNFPDFW